MELAVLLCTKEEEEWMHSLEQWCWEYSDDFIRAVKVDTVTRHVC